MRFYLTHFFVILTVVLRAFRFIRIFIEIRNLKEDIKMHIFLIILVHLIKVNGNRPPEKMG